ncbi:hypothetical protein Poli38472_009755 [Pythium oligandrum]|uniref:Uncharacterized protein n=1 Tax=Pythium oligandrum TaxID=41045 RepID=A0A8K1CHJ9_PYTOL|nr:hypothetical protein Poli38472_009755 [Pythium oligandrum]|eukprot:TMW62262.1 hypothetical protein Poli38472_009755 [Pythium oligandrum]
MSVTKDDLFDYDEGKSYTIGDGKAEMSFTYTGESNSQSNGLKYLQIKNQSASALYFAFCTTSKCDCHVCQEWIRFETIPLVDEPGWTVGCVVVEPFQTKVERFCSQWDCIGTCFLGSWPSEVKKTMLFDYDETRDYTIAGGKAELCFSYQKPQPASQQVKENNQNQNQNSRKSGGLGVAGANNQNSRTGGALGVLGAISTANQVYIGGKFVQDIFDGTTGPEDNALADVIGNALEGVAGGCVIS